MVIVNDAPAVLDLYRDMLEELGCETVLMVTEAIETGRISDALPDAVILDLEVGLQMDYGVEMAKQLRADDRYMAIPIVVATAHAEALDGGWRALGDIGVPVLIKPFTLDELGDALELQR